jgi:hypothetical protein
VSVGPVAVVKFRLRRRRGWNAERLRTGSIEDKERKGGLQGNSRKAKGFTAEEESFAVNPFA